MSVKARQLQDRLPRPAPIDPDAPAPGPVAPPAPPPSTRPAPAAARRPSALEDPAYDMQAKGYHSFYVPNAIYARFRAAIHYTANRPDAEEEGLAGSMSAAVTAFLQATAEDLERRFNGGEVFQMPPSTKRRTRRGRGIPE